MRVTSKIFSSMGKGRSTFLMGTFLREPFISGSRAVRESMFGGAE